MCLFPDSSLAAELSSSFRTQLRNAETTTGPLTEMGPTTGAERRVHDSATTCKPDGPDVGVQRSRHASLGFRCNPSSGVEFHNEMEPRRPEHFADRMRTNRGTSLQHPDCSTPRLRLDSSCVFTAVLTNFSPSCCLLHRHLVPIKHHVVSILCSRIQRQD